MLLGALPKTFQDGATKLLHNQLKNSSSNMVGWLLSSDCLPSLVVLIVFSLVPGVSKQDGQLDAITSPFQQNRSPQPAD